MADDATIKQARTNNTSQPGRSTPQPQPQQEPLSTQPPNNKKRKKRPSKPHILSQLTLRKLQWSYIHLQHLTPPTSTSPQDLDAITAHQHISAALRQFLGLHGAAIAFDILKLEGRDVWIRIAAEDRTALVAAVGGWTSSGGEGWRVVGWSSWDAETLSSSRDGGQDLFVR